MKTYLAVKIVKGKPYPAVVMPGERPVMKEPGDIISETEFKHMKDGYKVFYEDGYVSWCPLQEFKKHNVEILDVEVEACMEEIDLIKERYKNYPTRGFVFFNKTMDQMIKDVDNINDMVIKLNKRIENVISKHEGDK